MLPDDEFQVILVGLNEKQLHKLPKNVMGVMRTNSAQELAEYYSMASVFVNPTYEDIFPTVNLEALACGTPVITYRTGGSLEAVLPETGWVVEKGDTEEVVRLIRSLADKPASEIQEQRKACRQRAEEEYDQSQCFQKYLDLYESLIR